MKKRKYSAAMWRRYGTISKQAGTSERWAHRLDVPPPSQERIRLQREREARAVRNTAIHAMRERGAILQEIADKFGISREWVRQILLTTKK